MTSGHFHAVSISEITVIRDERIRKRLNNIDELAESIYRLGLIHPIVITRENKLVAGERRLTSCKQLGWTHISAQYTDELDEFTLKIIELEENLKREDLVWQDWHNTIIDYHNLRKSADPTWTEEKTGQAINMTKQAINSHIITEEEMNHPDVKGADSFKTARNTARRLRERKEADELNVLSKPGLPYTQSPIINADFHAWSAEYDGPRFNLIHCDFPYGINSQESGQNPSGYDDNPDIYWELIRSLCVNLDRFCAPSAHIMFWFSPTFFCQTWELLKLLDGFKFDELPLVWVRSDQQGIAPDAQRRPRRIYETAFFGWRNDRKLIRMKNNAFVGPSPSGDHAHEKSEAALSYFFEMLVDSQTSILDPTCGSGSALRAARGLGASRVLGIESNKEFADDARRAYDTWNRERRPTNSDLATS